jgi:hypothetical protein
MLGVRETRRGIIGGATNFASGDIYAVRGTGSSFERSSGTISQLIGTSFVRGSG